MNTPVSFELAKLLKEKEFDEPTKVWHQRGNGIVGCVEGQRDFFNRKGNVYTSAPTIAEVVMWLYEKHEIWIGVICDVGNDLLFTFKIYSTKIGEERCIVNGNMYESPIEAYEAAIEYTLKNLSRYMTMTRIKVEVEFEIDDEMWGANSQDIEEKKWFWDSVIPTSVVILHSAEVGDTISQTSKFTIKEITQTQNQ